MPWQKKVRGNYRKNGTVQSVFINKKYLVLEKFLVGRGCRVSTEAVAYLHNVPFDIANYMLMVLEWA